MTPRTLYIQTWGGTNTTARASSLSGALRGDGRMASLHSEEVDPHYVFDITEEGASLTVHILTMQSRDTFHIITEVQNVTETPFKTYVRRILTVK